MNIQYDELVQILMQYWEPKPDDVPPDEIITIQFPIDGKRRMKQIGYYEASNRRTIHVYAGENKTDKVWEIEIA